MSDFKSVSEAILPVRSTDDSDRSAVGPRRVVGSLVPCSGHKRPSHVGPRRVKQPTKARSKRHELGAAASPARAPEAGSAPDGAGSHRPRNPDTAAALAQATRAAFERVMVELRQRPRCELTNSWLDSQFALLVQTLNALPTLADSQSEATCERL